jgi:cytochrome c peroxidase
MDVRSVPNATSLGTGWTGRNAPSCVDAAYQSWFFWDGRADSLWLQALGPAEAPAEMGGTRLGIAHLLYQHYRADYDAIFTPALDPALDPQSADAGRFPPEGKPKASPADADAAWETMTSADRDIADRIFVNFGKAIAAYERRLISRDAPFDAYVAGQSDALSPAAKRGLGLFIGKANCSECHSGPLFSDAKFHNIGVPQLGDRVPTSDGGRGTAIEALLANPFNGTGAYSDDPTTGKLEGLATTTADLGAFRTPSLRQIAETAPYMHTGELATLDEVVEFYNLGGADSGFLGQKDGSIRPLNLTPAEMRDLVAFLETLTGDPIPASLALDTSVR